MEPRLACVGGNEMGISETEAGKSCNSPKPRPLRLSMRFADSVRKNDKLPARTDRPDLAYAERETTAHSPDRGATNLASDPTRGSSTLKTSAGKRVSSSFLRFFAETNEVKQQRREGKNWVKSPQNSKHGTIIHFAVDRGYQKLLEAVTRDGKESTQLNQGDSNGYTPLHYAMVKDDENMIQTLILHGASGTSLGVSSACHEAVKRQKLGQLQLLLDAQPLMACEVDNEGKLPLYYAISVGNSEIVQLLLSFGALKDWSASTALHEVVEKEQTEIGRLLISSQPELLSVKNERGDTALHAAVRKASIVLVELFASNNPYINETCANTQTALHLAVLGSSRILVKTLLENGARLNDQDYNKNTPLHIAIKTAQDPEVVNALLVTKRTYHFTLQDTSGQTPLHTAVLKESTTYVRILASANSSAITALNKDRLTPMDLAIYLSSSEIMKVLLEEGENADVQLNLTRCLYIPQLIGNEIVVVAQSSILRKAWPRQEILGLLLQRGAFIPGAEEMWFMQQAAVYSSSILELLLKHGAKIDAMDESGATALQRVVADDNLEGARVLLTHGANPDSRASRGKSPIYGCVLRARDASAETLEKTFKPMIQLLLKFKANIEDGAIIDSALKSPALFKILLDHGADINVYHKGRTLLHAAVCSENKDAVKLLLMNGADPNLPGKSFGDPEIRGLTAIFTAIAKRSYGIISDLLRCPKTNINYVNSNRETPIFEAIRQGDADIVRKLLRLKCICRVKNNDDQTPIHILAGLSNHWEEDEYDLILEKMLSGDKWALHLRNLTDSRIPILVAASKGSWYLVKSFIHLGSALDCKDKSGSTVLHYATRDRALGAVRSCLTAGMSGTIRDDKDYTPCHYAVEQNLNEIAVVFLQHCVDLRKGQSGRELLLLSLTTKNMLMMELLLDKYGADPNTIATQKQLTLLHIAVGQGNPALVRLLFRKGARANPLTTEGLSPLAYASTIEQDALREEIVNILLDNHANPDATVDNTKATVLHRAVYDGDHSFVKALLAKGANAKNIATDGLTPLAIAVVRGKAKIAIALLENGADAKQLLPVGDALPPNTTLLHYALRLKDMDLATSLIRFGADFTRSTPNGITTIFKVLQNSSDSCLQMLMEKGVSADTVLSEDGSLGVPKIHRERLSNGMLSALMVATLNGSVNCVRVLLKSGANPNLATSNEQTPLHIAILNNVSHIGEIARLLIEAGANANIPDAINHMTAVQLAVARKKPALLRILLSRERGDIEFSTSIGGAPFLTALQLAVKVDFEAGADLLLRHGADLASIAIIRSRDANGEQLPWVPSIISCYAQGIHYNLSTS